MLEGSPWSVMAFAAMPGNTTVTAGNTNNNMLGANTLKLFALPANSKLVFMFGGTRLNTVAGGSGAYRYRIDGVNVGPINTYVNTIRGACYLQHIATLGPGDHTVDISMTAAVGDETLHDSGTLIALAAIGT